MGCPCMNPKTREIEEVSAKTKEMVYRMQNPSLINLIEKEKSQYKSKTTIITHGAGKK